MAKFCGNCGLELEDNAKVCGKCGAPLEDSSKTLQVKIVDLEKRRQLKKRLRLAIGLVSLAVIAFIVYSVSLHFLGTNGLVRKVMAAYEDYDIDTLVTLSSDMYYFGKDDYVERYLQNSVGRDLDSFEAAVGHKYKISYELKEMYDLSERRRKDVLDDIEGKYPDFDVGIIKRIVVAELTVTARQGGKSASQGLKITMTKENNSWKLLYME